MLVRSVDSPWGSRYEVYDSHFTKWTKVRTPFVEWCVRPYHTLALLMTRNLTNVTWKPVALIDISASKLFLRYLAITQRSGVRLASTAF